MPRQLQPPTKRQHRQSKERPFSQGVRTPNRPVGMVEASCKVAFRNVGVGVVVVAPGGCTNSDSSLCRRRSHIVFMVLTEASWLWRVTFLACNTPLPQSTGSFSAIWDSVARAVSGRAKMAHKDSRRAGRAGDAADSAALHSAKVCKNCNGRSDAKHERCRQARLDQRNALTPERPDQRVEALTP